MADNRYRERGHGRSDSIFSDDERGRGTGSGAYRGERSDDEHGFFERAGEEVRSWFGSDDDRGERQGRGTGGGYASSRSDYSDYREDGSRMGQSGNQDYAGSYGRSHGGSGGRSDNMRNFGGQREPWGGGSDWSQRGRQAREGDLGQGSFTQTQGGRSPFDDHYRSWRDRQISQLDREYDEYCRHRQQQFESDFHNWRQNRQGQGQGQQGGTASGRTGTAGQAEGSGTTKAQSGGASAGMSSGGATAEGGSNLSASDASTGSSGTGSRSRGGRSSKAGE